MPRSRPYSSTIGRPNTITPDHTAVEERSGFSQSISSEISDGRLSQGAKGHLNYFYLKRLCRERGLLFEDLEFLPGNRLCFGMKQKTSIPVIWMRPHELSSRPKFISTDTTKFDVEQGGHGDHYLLAAISCLTLTPKFLDRVVPPDQTFSGDYCGIFRFRFWTFGEWTEVVIDDRLPSFKGRLVCLHSSDPNEFWSALLEKAYAKLYGGYHMLEKGSVARALQDLTGGIAQSFHLPKHDHHVLFQMINSAVPSSTLLAAGIVHESKKTTRLPNGLLTRHAYSITGLAWVRNRFGEIPLIRLRNPAGKGEWNGPWSERSWEWDSLPRRDKDLNLRVRNEGEFWMSFDDFMKSFTHLDLLHIGPDDWTREPALHNKRPWRAVLAKRRFRRGYNAGGGPKNPESVPSNPQFHIHIPKSSAKKCHMVIAVTQQYTNQPNNKKSSLFPIGFIIYEVPPNVSRLSLEFITSNQPLDLTVFTPSRETVTFFTLPPGDYVVLPCTKDANCETVFLLRILIDEQCKIWEVNEDNTLFQDVIYVRNGDVGTLNVKNTRFVLSKILQKVCSSPDPFQIPAELDARLLLKVLKMCWRQLKILSEKPTFELSRCLLMLKDPSIAGRITAHDLQALMTILQRWKTIFIKYDQSHSGKTSSYHLRSLFWDAGISTSNKVLECIVIRYVKNSSIKMEDFFLALVKLNLAHERYRAAEKKMKENRLSLEEIILMTIYS